MLMDLVGLGGVESPQVGSVTFEERRWPPPGARWWILSNGGRAWHSSFSPPLASCPPETRKPLSRGRPSIDRCASNQGTNAAVAGALNFLLGSNLRSHATPA